MVEPVSGNQEFIRRLSDIILKNLSNENFGIKDLAYESGLSRYSLSRKLNNISKKTPNQFIREVRLQRAIEMLQTEPLTASEIAYKVGFSSPTYFNKCFREFFGFPPGKAKELGLKSPEINKLVTSAANQAQHKHARRRSVQTISGILFLIILIAIIIFLVNTGILKRSTLDDLRSSGTRLSLVVLPFQNMTNDTAFNTWQDGIQDCLISSLSDAPELKVRQKETIRAIFQAKGLSELAALSPAIASTISHKLDAKLFIYGSIEQSELTIRLNAQLIDTKTKAVIKSFQIDGPSEEVNMFNIIDSLSAQIKSFLIISKLKMENPNEPDLVSTTTSPEAYRCFIYGNRAFSKADWPLARIWYSQALAIDSNFTDAAIQLSAAYGNQGMTEQAMEWVLWLYKKRDLMPMVAKIWTNWSYAINFERPSEQIKYLKQLVEIDDQLENVYFLLGLTYNFCHQYDKAIPELEKSLEIFHKWHAKPFWVFNYAHLGLAYHKTGQSKKEKKLYRKAERDFPDNPILISRQAILALTEGYTITADRYLEKYVSISKQDSCSEADIAQKIAMIYADAGILDKAEDYYQKALSLEPEKPDRVNNLALFLIDNDRNVNEGLKLVEKALELNPDNFHYLDTKGWGLYKQGKFKEAIECLEISRDVKPGFDFDLYLHLEEVKKASENYN
jgi:tetratricopeptide (TPR) repeat protein/AraC-like DNA-binding protein